MTTQNEAAERLREWLDDGLSTVGGDRRPWEWLDAALAAERAAGRSEGTRATVERIRDAMPSERHDHAANQDEEHGYNSALHAVLAILDEEAAR